MVAVTSGLYVVYDDWFYRNVGKNWNERSYNTCSSILNAFTSAALCGAVAISAHPLYEELFSILFGVLAVLLIPPIASDIIYLKRISRRSKKFKVDPVLTMKIRVYLLIGLALALFSTFAWIIPETICKSVAGSQYYLFWSHGVWHLGMSYSLITVAQAIIYIHLVETDPDTRKEVGKNVVRNKFNCKCGNKCCCGCFAHAFFTFFLIVQPHFFEFNETMVLCTQGRYLTSRQYDVGNALQIVGNVRNLVDSKPSTTDKKKSKKGGDRDKETSEEEKEFNIDDS